MTDGQTAVSRQFLRVLFNSFPFVVFLLVTLSLYYLPWFRRLQTALLILASFFFYAYGQPRLVLLLITSILINASASYGVLNGRSRAGRRWWAGIGVGLNLAILFLFKYGPLVARTLDLDANGGSMAHLLITIPLPIGISFFTFQGISLLIDVFRQEETGVRRVAHRSVWHHFLDTAFFKAFFPQLVAGPIVKAHDFYPQIGPKRLADIPWEGVFRALLVGYFLKMVLADNLKDLTFWIAYPYFLKRSALTLLAMLFGYSMQIFADFAGYSLIAIGLARLFGYELMQNFNFPYISQSLAEFWRRWHISLSTWLREYLYIPLGGNRKGEGRTYLNLIAVMVLGGLWHGAAWSYAVWGLFHGLGLAAERWWQRGGRLAAPEGFSPLRAFFVFCFVTVAWLLFKLPKFEHVMAFLKACWENGNLPTDTRTIAFILFYSAPVLIYHVFALRRERAMGPVPATWKNLGYAVCLFALVVNSGSSGAFIYFQF